MRIGVMIGAERGDLARKVDQDGRRHRVGRGGGSGHRVDAAGARRLRRADHGGADGRAHVADRAGHRGRAAAGAAPDRPCPPGAFGARLASGRLALGVGPSHHWIVRDMLGLPVREAGRVHPRLPRGAQRRAARTGPGRRRERHVHRAQPDGAGRRGADAGAGRRARAGDAADRGRARRRHRAVDGRRARHRRPRRAADHQGRRRRGPAGAAHRRGHPGLPVRQLGDRRGQGARQPHSRRGGDVPELPAAAGSRRCPRRRRPVRRRRRGGHPGAVPAVRRRRGHRPVGAAAADRRQPRRAHRVQIPDPRGDFAARRAMRSR